MLVEPSFGRVRKGRGPHLEHVSVLGCDEVDCSGVSAAAAEDRACRGGEEGSGLRCLSTLGAEASGGHVEAQGQDARCRGSPEQEIEARRCVVGGGEYDHGAADSGRVGPITPVGLLREAFRSSQTR